MRLLLKIFWRYLLSNPDRYIYIYMSNKTLSEPLLQKNVKSGLFLDNIGIKLTAKTVDEDPASYKRWISRKEI